MSFCITKDTNIQKSALQFLNYTDPIDEQINLNETNGRILSNLKYSWFVNGSKLVVCSCKNGARVGSWNFRQTFKDETCEILDVVEIQRSNGREPFLAISVNCDSVGGVICIFDFLSSKIIRAINVVEEISTLHVIDSGQDVINLSGPLRNFDGVLAVGTAGANVYIIDLYRQLCDEGCDFLKIGEEFKMYQMKMITSVDLHHIENHKQDALQFGSHLAIHLNVVLDKQTEHFILKQPNGSDVVHVNRGEVRASALHYCPQLGSILVGYNFGAFQLWNLMNMTLTYTSPICEDHIPITKFAVQEPADDPRAFCYIWAVYSMNDSDSGLLPYLVLYAMCFESKEIQESYGILYENFQYCVVRFHMELGFNHQSVVDIKGGRCLNLESIVQKTSMNSEVCVAEAGEEILSICIVLWRAVSENGPQTFMSMFDLNQWYKEQMPNTPNADDCGNYMITLCATDLTATAEEQPEVLDIVVQKKKLQQFFGVQKLEEHYYPSSLSFDVCCLLENRIVDIQYQGVQRALLYQIQSSGPLCLIRPTEIYEEIFSLGLIPLFVELSQHLPISLTTQREIILNVALEQQMTDWLCKCASEWANGSFSSAGCSLELLISWAFQRGIVLKNNCDNICKSLFDHSQIRLDGNTSNILNNCVRQIKNISLLYAFILKNFSNFLLDNDLLLERCQSLQMIEVYFDVLQWLFNVGLLPEYAPNSVLPIGEEDKIRAPFPADELVEYYKNRRAELQLKQTRHFPMNSSVLFIDNLIDIECGGSRLSVEWKNDGGDGFYPPRSLQALLRTYLIDGIEVCNKHAVVIYLFLDLAMILDPQKYSSVTKHLIKFPAVFKVSPSLIKLTQAFWQLDHGDLSTAMEQLLDPLINKEDLKYWHHKLALKSLLVQDQPNAALLYMNVKKPPIIDDEDVLCGLSLLISNNMIDEAFYMEKHFMNHFDSKKLIKHLLSECSHHGHFGNVINRHLTDEEEALFLEYLDEVQHPEAADLKVAYFMQRNHYVEAFKVYSKDQDPLTRGLVGRLTAKTRDQIVHNYKKLLPTVTYKFIESCSKEPNPKIWNEISMNKVKPVSVIMYKAKDYPDFDSAVPFTFMAKAKQTTHQELKSSYFLHSKTEETPFLRTSTVATSRKRRFTPLMTLKTLGKEDKYGPSPRKRRRLSPKSVIQPSENIETSILETPIISRKERSQLPITKDPNATPSILKNSPFISKRASLSRSTVRFDIPKFSLSSPVENADSSNESIEKSRPSQTEAALSPAQDSSLLKNNSDPEVLCLPNDLYKNGEMKVDESENNEEMEITYEANERGVESQTTRDSSYGDVIITTPKTSPQRRRSYKHLLNESLLKTSPRLDPTKLSSFRKSNSEKKPEKEFSEKVQARNPLHLNRDDDSLTKSISGDNAHISIFHTENTSIKTVENDGEIEVSCDKTEYSDVYSMESATPEKISERHSVIRTASSSKVLIDSDTESNDQPASANTSTSSNDSLMDFLVEDLRNRQLRSKQEKERIKNENSIETEPSQTVRRSRRLSAERLLPSDVTTKKDDSEAPLLTITRTRRKSSEERSLPSEEKVAVPRTRRSSVDRTTAAETPARRTSRRLSAERTVEATPESVNSPKQTSRTSKRLSEERNIAKADSSNEKTVEVLTLSPSRRITRRLSAERSISKEPSPIVEDDGKNVELLTFTSGRSSRILSMEKAKIEEPEAHCSSTPDKEPEIKEHDIPNSPGVSHIYQSPNKDLRRDPKVTYRRPYRKSLTRQVLENNTLVRLASEARKSDEQLGLLRSRQESPPVEKEEKEESIIEEKNEEIIDKNVGSGNISLSDSLLDFLNNFDTKPKINSTKNEDKSIDTPSNSNSIDLTTTQEPVGDKEDSDVSIKDSQREDFKKEETENPVTSIEMESEICENNVTSIDMCPENNEDFSMIYENLDPLEETNTCEISLNNLDEGRIEDNVIINIADDSEVSFETSKDSSLDRGRIEETEIVKTAPSTPSIFERNITLKPDVITLDENEPEIEKPYVIELDSSSENEDVQSVISAKTTNTAISSASSSASSRTTIIMNEKSVKKVDDELVKTKIEDSEQIQDIVIEDNAKEIADEESKVGERNIEESRQGSEVVDHANVNAQNEGLVGDREVEQVVPARRITRRSSRFSDSGSDVQKSVAISTDVKEKSDSLSAKSTKPRLSVDPSSPSQINVSELPEILCATSVAKPPKTYSRKRTRSCDTVLINENDGAGASSTTTVAARRNLRSTSVEVTLGTNTSSSPCDGPSVEKKSKRKPAKTEKNTTVATYALTRRLTRRQANLLEKTITEVDEAMVEASDDRLSSVEQQDRIELLDKPNFEGVPDPEEQKIYEKSPTSSTKSDTNSISSRRMRSSSVSSSKSSGSSLPESPKSKGSTRRLRSVSKEKDDVKSTERTNEKKTRRGENSSESSTRRTRSKKNDGEKADSDQSSVKSTRSTRSNSKRSDGGRTKASKKTTRLPEILEEPSEEDDKQPNLRRKRK